MNPLGQYMTVSEPVPSPSGKTNVWTIYDRRGYILGTVSWFGRWRCYAFNPQMMTTFNAACLGELATFCKNVTQEHRDK